MASFYKYKAMDDTGRMIEGEYSANSKEEVLSMLREKKQRPIKIELKADQSKDLGEIGFLKKKVNTKDIAVFCKQLYTMLNAGMPLSNCLEVLGEQTESKVLREKIKDIHSQVQTGAVLSQALRKHKESFPSLLITMIEAGEMTGNLDSVLARMSEHYDKENKINSKIQGAMVYPAVLSFLAVGVVIFLLTFIMPVFTGMFEGSGAELPGVTQMLMNISNALQKYWYVFILVIVGAVVLTSRYVKTPEGKKKYDLLLHKMPVIGSSTVKISTSRFTRTLSTLMASGIPIVQAMEASSSTTNNSIVIEGMKTVVEEVKKGINISSLLKNMDYFPPMVISMVSIGEESGALEDMLSKTADYYDEELDAAIQKMLSMLEPLLIIVMGGLIGFIVVAMMLPIFDLAKTVQ